MRLGGPVARPYTDPESWVAELRRLGYGAAISPIDNSADSATVHALAHAAEEADIVIAEVGAWSNPLARDPATRRAAIDYCERQLTLADELGAHCCVNIAGSLSERWDGPHPTHFDADVFALIVDTTRAIIDAVQPRRTAFALEAMPWIPPDGPESYLALVHAIDRPAFGVHLDPVNMISSPRLLFRSGELLRECFRLLGPWIKSCHAKDIALLPELTVRLVETVPGLGDLDYTTFLCELARLERDTPLILEHLRDERAYADAAMFIRNEAAALGLTFVGPGKAPCGAGVV